MKSFVISVLLMTLVLVSVVIFILWQTDRQDREFWKAESERYKNLLYDCQDSQMDSLVIVLKGDAADSLSDETVGDIVHSIRTLMQR